MMMMMMMNNNNNNDVTWCHKYSVKLIDRWLVRVQSSTVPNVRKTWTFISLVVGSYVWFKRGLHFRYKGKQMYILGCKWDPPSFEVDYNLRENESFQNENHLTPSCLWDQSKKKKKKKMETSRIDVSVFCNDLSFPLSSGSSDHLFISPVFLTTFQTSNNVSTIILKDTFCANHRNTEQFFPMIILTLVILIQMRVQPMYGLNDTPKMGKKQIHILLE